jgi:hypothetical protein
MNTLNDQGIHKCCIACGENKDLIYFTKNKLSKDGCNNECKDCNKKYREKNKEKIKEQKKKHYEKNKDKISNQSKKYYQENKDKIKETVKEWRCSNKGKIKKYQKKHYEKILKEKYNSDPLYKLTCNLRTRMYDAIKEGMGFKLGKSEELLGCTFEEVRNHLESLFKDGMTWENHGLYGWHIDHRRPCASFDLTKEDQQRECFHYTNLQPLWATENLSKSDKWDPLLVELEDLFE